MSNFFHFLLYFFPISRPALWENAHALADSQKIEKTGLFFFSVRKWPNGAVNSRTDGEREQKTEGEMLLSALCVTGFA